jgi:hypothetical protein
MRKLIIIVLFAGLSLALTSCGGLRNLDSILARDYIIGESLRLEIPVRRAYNAGDITEFAHSDDIFAFSNRVENMSSRDYRIDTRIFQDEYILVERTLADNSKNTLLLIIQYLGKTEDGSLNQYLYFPPIVRVNRAVSANEYEPAGFDFHLPYHLLKNTTYYPYIETTITFETIGSIDDFYRYYLNYGIYDVVERSEESMTVIVGQDVIYHIEITIIVDGEKTFARLSLATQ